MTRPPQSHNLEGGQSPAPQHLTGRAALSLDRANQIIGAAFERARALALKPLTVAVLDPGGHVVALQRQDGASNLRPRIAEAKAAGALALGLSSRAIAEIALERPAFVASLNALNTPGLVAAAGGVIIQTPDGDRLGAIGVTGDTSDNDELCALAGLAAAGLAASPDRR